MTVMLSPSLSVARFSGGYTDAQKAAVRAVQDKAGTRGPAAVLAAQVKTPRELIKLHDSTDERSVALLH